MLLTKLNIWLVQQAEFLGEHFQEENTNFQKMPKISTFERIFLSWNSVSFRLKKGKKSNDLLIIERDDYCCEKSIISVLTTFSTKFFHKNRHRNSSTKQNTLQHFLFSNLMSKQKCKSLGFLYLTEQRPLTNVDIFAHLE